MIWESPGSYIVFIALSIFMALWIWARSSETESGRTAGRLRAVRHALEVLKARNTYVMMIALIALAAACFAATRAFARAPARGANADPAGNGASMKGRPASSPAS
ncbi:MAG TPA: hypothetical protein VL523_17475 [Terriglobia bacterium]|nr:hypothetical protein [Terriglobia bacterium]